MDALAGFVVQLLNGLAGASSLFLVAAGLSLIFGVTRIVNFAHGSFYMVGIYVAYSAVAWLGGGAGYWLGLVLAAMAVGLLGAVVEMTLLRRIYHAPELFQLLATFALVLVIKDAALWIWGPEELLGPRAPGLAGSVTILGRQFPSYDLFLIVVGPLVLGLVWLVLTRTRFGTLVRAATQDREMVGALGVNQAWLFTGIFALGSALAALGGDAKIDPADHPRVRAAQVARDQAAYDVALTTVKAPADGVVYKADSFKPGQFVAAGSPLFTLVETGDTWIEANFKETQIARIAKDDPVEVDVDAVGSFRGVVDSVAPATGARFSLFPPDNATGNFVKVVQRVPVKIVLDSGQDPEHLLRPGMSVTPTVYTK